MSNGYIPVETIRTMSNSELMRYLIQDTGDRERLVTEVAKRIASRRLIITETPPHQNSDTPARSSSPPPKPSTPHPTYEDKPPFLNDGVDRPLQAYAQKIVAAGYKAQFMREPEFAMLWITAMAEGRNDEHDMPEEGQRFWKGVKSKYPLWEIQQRNNR